jgi:dephospho-CoA kinase
VRARGRAPSVAVTGGIGCGKSEVGRLLGARGAAVFDADVLAREAMAPGTRVAAAVKRSFGSAVVGPDGAIDRAALAAVVFRDPAARRRLEALVHPRVIRRLRQGLASARAAGRIGVAVVPLLFETGLEDLCDVTLCVIADADLTRARLRARGMAPAEARRRMAAQMPLKEKARRSDVVIENNGTRNALCRKVDAFYEDLMRRKER